MKRLVLLFLTTLASAIILAEVFKVSPSQQIGMPQMQGQVQESQAFVSQKTDFDCESTDLIANFLYRHPSNLYDPVTTNGVSNANIDWEQHRSARWYIEEQRYAEERIIGGLLKNDLKALNSGFKMFDWGFAHQSTDGSFDGTADAFHSTSFFVQAVAHTLLFIEQSPQARKYADKIAHYQPLVHRAALWMISPSVWKRGTERNQTYTHRRYLVAAALGLTGKLAGNQDLINYARQSIQDGLSLQLPDGVNPEKGGYDSSYQMVGVVYAQRWLTHFSNDALMPKVAAMIDKALAWEQTRILPTGEISTEGNSRTAGQERGRSGKVKVVSHRMALRGFAYWAEATGSPRWQAIANQIAQYYYQMRS